MPITFFLTTGNLLNTVVLLEIVIILNRSIRMIIGDRPMYCKRVMLKKNWQELKESIKFTKENQPYFFHYPVFAVLLCVLTIMGVLSYPDMIARPIPLIVIVLGYVLGKAREIRIFLPMFLWLAMGIIR